MSNTTICLSLACGTFITVINPLIKHRKLNINITNLRSLCFRQDKNDLHFKVIVTVDLTSQTRVQGADVERTIKDHISDTNNLGDLTATVDGNYQFTVLKGKLD